MNKLYKLIAFFAIAIFLIIWLLSDQSVVIADSSSWYSQTISNIYNSWDMIITEVHPQTTNNCLDEYIIIQSNIYYNGKIEIPWLGTSSASINIYAELQTWQKLLITDNIAKLNSWNADLKIYITNTITLTNSWEPLSIKISWHIVDNIYYDNYNGDQSKFFAYNSGSVRRFGINAVPTPSNSCIIYIQPNKPSAECEIYITDLNSTNPIKLWIRWTFTGDISNNIWSWMQESISNSNEYIFTPVHWRNQVTFKAYSGSNIICQNSFTYYQDTNIVTNCQSGSTSNSTSSTNNNSIPKDSSYLDSCGIKLQTSNFLYSENYVNLVSTIYGSYIYNTNTWYNCYWDFGDWSSSSECNPWSKTFYKAWLYNVKLTITDKNNGRICTPRYDLNLPSRYWMINYINDPKRMQDKEFDRQNFTIHYEWVIKSWDYQLCDKSYYKLLYDKTKDKYSYLLNLYQIDEKELKYISTGYIYSGNIDLLSWFLSSKINKSDNSSDINDIEKKYNLNIRTGDDRLHISSIIPNPVWSDKSWEFISLYSDYEGSLDGYYIYYGSKKYPLWWYISWDMQIIHNFGFANSDTCVYLWDQQYIYDVVCYKTAKSWYIYGSGFDDEWYASGTKNKIKNSDKRKYILPIVSNKYMSWELFCGASTDKYIKQIEKLKKTNQNLKNTNSKNRKSYTARVAKLNVKLKSNTKYYSDREKYSRYQLYLYKNYSTIINSILKKDYDIVWQDQQIQNYYELLNVWVQKLKSGYVDGYYDWNKIKSYDLKKIYKVLSWSNIYSIDIFWLINPDMQLQNINQIEYNRNYKYIQWNKTIKNQLYYKPITNTWIYISDNKVLLWNTSASTGSTGSTTNTKITNQVTTTTKPNKLKSKTTSKTMIKTLNNKKYKDVILPNKIDTLNDQTISKNLIIIKVYNPKSTL